MGDNRFDLATFLHIHARGYDRIDIGRGRRARRRRSGCPACRCDRHTTGQLRRGEGGRVAATGLMLMKKHLLSSSKFLSLVLRHDPAAIGLELDPGGWANVAELLAKMAAAGHHLRPEDLAEIITTNEKKRFVVEGGRIRAQQGHSIDVELGLSPMAPPEELFHGSAEKNRESILKNGLHPAARQHVHLSHEAATALQVGSRHGRPLIFVVASGAMHSAGHAFYLSGNGVWLCDRVPPEFIRVEA